MAQLQMETYYYTPEEYLALEDKAEYKSEYIDGQIFAMSGGTLIHNEISFNVCASLKTALKGKNCKPYIGDVKVLVGNQGAFLYPDVLVVCGKPQFFKNRHDIVSNPILVVEVLSKSTGNYDRQGKFGLYQEIESLQDYLLIDQNRLHVQHYHKLPDGRWVVTIFTHLDSAIQLESLDITLPLSEIYEAIDWAE